MQPSTVCWDRNPPAGFLDLSAFRRWGEKEIPKFFWTDTASGLRVICRQNILQGFLSLPWESFHFNVLFLEQRGIFKFAKTTEHILQNNTVGLSCESKANQTHILCYWCQPAAHGTTGVSAFRPTGVLWTVSSICSQSKCQDGQGVRTSHWKPHQRSDLSCHTRIGVSAEAKSVEISMTMNLENIYKIIQQEQPWMGFEPYPKIPKGAVKEIYNVIPHGCSHLFVT